MEKLLQDIFYGLRVLRKNIGFTAVAVWTLALGIGANTAVFSILNALFSVPLPVDDPDRVVIAYSRNQAQNLSQSPVSADDFLDWREQSRSFEHLIAAASASYNFAGQGEPVRVQAFSITSGFFPLMGRQLAVGRTFRPQDSDPGADKVAILSHSFWQQTFGADPGALGGQILLDGRKYTVIGVADQEFFFPSRNTSLWTPLTVQRGAAPRDSRSLFVMGRLNPGVSVEQAGAEMASITASLAQAYPGANQGWDANLQTLRDNLIRGSALALTVLYTAISFVLLIACANVANLLSARGASRQREIALRTALGAGRLRLVRQLLTESVVLALMGGCLGLLLGLWGMSVLKGMFNANPQLLTLTQAMRLDTGMFLHTAAISLLAGIAFGLFPALQTSKPDLQSTLQEGGRGSVGMGKHRLRNVLVMAQVALALALLSTSTLLVRATGQVWAVDPGFESENLLTLQISIPEASYPEDADSLHFYQRAVERLQALPGVSSATTASRFPVGLFSNNPTSRVTVEGNPASEEDKSASIIDVTVSPSYFETLGLPIVRGRGLADSDSRDSLPVAVVSKAFVERYWPDTEPLGKRFKVGPPDSERPWFTVVGVSQDMESLSPSLSQPQPTLPHAFIPLEQNPSRAVVLMLRTQLDPSGLAPAVRNAIWEIDPDQAVSDLLTMQARLEQQRVGSRTVLDILGALSAIALLLSGVGIYGVISYSVNQRRHTIGIRKALGAQPADVLKLVLKQGAVLAVIGLAIGTLLALGLNQVLSAQLPGLSGTGASGPLTYASMALLLLMVALSASYIPARRAMRVDPMVTLRCE